MFLELIKKSYRIYHPYFGLKGKGLYHTLLSVLIIIGNISLAFFMSLINAAFDSLMASIVPGVSYRVFFASTGYFLLACLAYSGVVSANNWLAGRLGASIAHQYNKNIVARWLNSGAYFGTKFMGSGYSRVLMCSETPKERDKKTIYLIKKNQTTNIEYWAEDGSIKQFVLDDTWPDEIKKAK